MQSIHDLNRLADDLDTKGMADESLAADDKGGAIQKVKVIYEKVRPFLDAVGNLFFVPKKWRAAINTFVAVMDGLTAIEISNE